MICATDPEACLLLWLWWPSLELPGVSGDWGVRYSPRHASGRKSSDVHGFGAQSQSVVAQQTGESSFRLRVSAVRLTRAIEVEVEAEAGRGRD